MEIPYKLCILFNCLIVGNHKWRKKMRILDSVAIRLDGYFMAFLCYIFLVKDFCFSAVISLNKRDNIECVIHFVAVEHWCICTCASAHAPTLQLYILLIIFFFADFFFVQVTKNYTRSFCKWYQTFSVYNLFFSLCWSSHLICAISVVASKKKKMVQKIHAQTLSINVFLLS